MELKTTSTLKKKDKLVKKLIAKFGGVEEVDKSGKIFGSYDVIKSKVEIKLKTTSTLRRRIG